MNMQIVKKYMPLLTWGVYAAAVVLVLSAATRVYGHVASTRRLDETVARCKTQNKPDEQKTKDLLAQAKKTGDELKKKNVFVPPPPKPNPPTCQGVIGSSALFGDKLYKAGEKVGGAEIVSVGTTEVVIKWEDKEMTLVPFESDSRSSGGSDRSSDRGGRTAGPARPVSSSPPPPPGGASNVQVPPGGPQGGARGAIMNMSPEERQQLVDRFRNMSTEEQQRFREEQRQRFGERGGPGGGPRGRGR